MPIVQSWVWRMVEPSVQVRSGAVVMVGAGAGAWRFAGVVIVTMGTRMGFVSPRIGAVGATMDSR